MRFLNFTDTYNYQVTDTVSGWKISISDKNGHVRLPLILDDKIDKKLSKSPKSSAIMLVSDLLSESLIYEKNHELYIAVDIYWCLTESERNIIGLPVIYSEDIKLESHCAIGVSDFNVNAYVYDNGQLTKSYVQKNHILRTESETRVLDDHQIQIFDDLKKISNAKETLEQFEAVAKLKTDALKSNVIFDDYLKSEEINFADGFDVDVEVINPSEIRLLPMFKSLNENQNSIVNNSEIKTYYNENREDGKKTRVFLKDSEVENIRSLEEIKIIKDFDVPKFLDNPISYIGDSIDFDMSKFSERVKGIKIHKYKAQPFIHVNESESLNWFDLDIGIRLDSGDDENESKELDLESFLELVEEAEENDGFARLGDGWLEIDTQQARSFIDAIEQVGDIDDDALNNSINITGLQKILEIFENIQKLEYNQGFFNVVEKIKASGLGQYIKPDGLKATLYGYQKVGHQWMKSLDVISAGGLMADDMGLGKTVQVISYLQSLKNVADILPTLIVLPSALIDNWVDEINNFSTGIECRVYHKSYGKLATNFDDYDVYLTTYETLVRNQIELGKVDWEFVVCDEAQKIKNASTFASNAVKALKSKRRIALTGTPVENGLNELWSIMDFVQPGLLGCYQSFKKEFELPIQREHSKIHVDELLTRIKPVYIRRTKSEKLVGLPSITDEKIFAKMSKEQTALYLEQLTLGRMDKKQRLPAITRMITIASHPRALSGDLSVAPEKLISESPKLQETLNIIDSIKLKGEKVIIFTKLRNMQSILRRVIYYKYKIDPVVINGQTKENRNVLISDFSNVDGFNIIVLSPKAAGVGLNITAANHVIHYTRDWNPAVEKQATDRTFRIGQKKDVKVYYPIVGKEAFETVEEKLDKLLEKKKALIDQVVVSKEQFKELDNDMMEILFE